MLWLDSLLSFLMDHGSTVGVVVLATLVTLAGMFVNHPGRRAGIMEYMCDVCFSEFQKEGIWGRLKMDEKQLGFAVFLIHALAREWRRPCGWVYQTLNGSGLLDDYILAFYDVLHTQGREYLVEDITGFARDKGISV